MDDFNDKDGEDEEDPFEWYYDLEDDDKEYFWTEFSHYRFDRKTTWNDFELNDLELFLLEEG